jgi:hypothetical protein
MKYVINKSVEFVWKLDCDFNQVDVSSIWFSECHRCMVEGTTARKLQ